MTRAGRLAVPALLAACAAPSRVPPAAAPPPPMASRSAIELRPGGTLAAALARAQPGGRVVVRAGAYPREEIRARFSDFVTVEAAPGETATFAGVTFTDSEHLRLRGLRFSATLRLEHSARFDLSGLDLDAGESGASALYLLTRRPGGEPTRGVRVAGSRIRGGGRTVFLHTHFRPADGWTNGVEIVDNEMSCGARCCFQLSGAADVLIAGNRIVAAKGKGVLLAGATRVRILRNRMENGHSVAVQIGTPGVEWDRFAGVEHMISSHVLVASNAIRNWGGPAIQLDGCRDVDLRGNTVEGARGLVTHRRAPTDMAGNTILVGNTSIRLSGNRLPAIEIADGDPPPTVEP